ncbi:MAG: hypothetical protein ACLROE_01695 [Collinsella intestinalis]
METQPPETRLKVLETSYAKLDERVTTHGKEIDALKEHQVRTEEHDAFRDKQMASVESKVDRIDGKLDLMAAKPAEKWDKATWVVVSVVITAVVTSILSRISF